MTRSRRALSVSFFFLLYDIEVLSVLFSKGWVQQKVSGHFNLIPVLVSNSFRNFCGFLVVYSVSPTILQDTAL